MRSLFAASLLAAFGLVHDVPANYLAYPSFEQSEKNGKVSFIGWEVGPSFDVEGVTKIGKVTQSAGPQGGSAIALEFTKSGFYNLKPTGLNKPVPITPGNKYKVSVTIKGTGGPFVLDVKVVERDGTKGRSPEKKESFQVTEDWKTVSFEWEAGAGRQLAFVSLTVNNKGETGTVTVANVSVEDV